MNNNKYMFKERQTVPNGNLNLSKNKLTKSYTSFHPKKTLSKNKSNKIPLKKPEYLNHKKYSKTNRILFSNKKEKYLDYLKIKPLSPQNKFSDINKNHIYMDNIPSSDHRLNKYNKRYVFDNIKKYRKNLIMDYNIKTNNNEENKNREKNVLKQNSITDNNSDNNSKKTNGASSNNIINNNIALNNSLIRSSENFLNTIAMTLTNNNNEASIQSNRIRFCGLNNIGLGCSTNKVNNLNNYSTNPRNKILNRFKKKANQLNKNNKNMNNLKNQNLNGIKKTEIFKTKSKTNMKPSYHIFSKEKKNSSKKCHKSSTNIANSIVTNANTNSKNIKQTDNNNNLPLDESDKTKMNEESNNNSDKNNHDKDLFYQTVENNHFNGDIINNNFNFLNIINTSNKRNNDSQKEGLNTIKTSNTMKSYHQNVNISNNINEDNNKNIINNNINIIENNIIENIESKDDIAFQTYSGSFRENIIKVNILDKAKILNKKLESIKSSIIVNDTINSNDQKTIFKNNNGTKSANNLMANISNSNIAKEDDKVSLYITTEIHSNNKNNKNNKINLKNNIINKFNKNTLDQGNKYKNITITNHSPKKKNFKLNKQKTEYNKNIKNNTKQNKLNKSLNCSQSNYKTDKANTPSISKTLNLNLYPLNKAKTRGYIKKKSSTSNLNEQSSNGNPNLTSNTNRSSVYKHKKNNSISSSIYNTQRTINKKRFNLKNKSSKIKKKNNLYSSPKNKVEIYQENTSILVPEYTIKFENIKSRVSNLLNIYSLLALKSINDINNKEIEENEEIEINENEN